MLSFRSWCSKSRLVASIIIFTTLIILTVVLLCVLLPAKKSNTEDTSGLKSSWRWECKKNSCQKERITPETEETALSRSACQLLCSDCAGLWPMPTGGLKVDNNLVKINFNSIDVVANSEGPAAKLMHLAIQEFKKDVRASVTGTVKYEGKPVIVTVDIQNETITRLALDTDESYSLVATEISKGSISAVIKASNFFGARHGLQTLSQLIIYDDLRGEMLIPRNFSIADKPAYPYRGVFLDTSRNYINIETMKRTIRAMGASKLNTFHWHITDSQSFPFDSKSHPEFTKLGAYSPSKVYKHSEIREIIDYAAVRGIRVIPEFDSPAHVGEGFQDQDYMLCFNGQPWEYLCAEPPCGQFDPTNDKVYDVIEDIYGDMLEQFQPDIFHMGADEVSFPCWNRTDNVKQWMAKKGWGDQEKDFVLLWNHYQTQAYDRLMKRAGKNMTVMIWTSHLTHEEYLNVTIPDKDQYLIQVWTKISDPQMDVLLEKGYKVIISNYDGLYMDCGYASWISDGKNWCSPYVGWAKVYENKPSNFTDTRKDQIFGAESILWTEQVDSTAVDNRLWPRSAAMAEIYWSEPATGWKEAERRFLVHRERLVNMGITADSIEPEWCMQNEENCRVGASSENFY